MADVPGTGSCTVFVILFPVAFFVTTDGRCPVRHSCMHILYGLSTYMMVYTALCLGLNHISLSERYLWYLITNFELRTPAQNTFLSVVFFLPKVRSGKSITDGRC